jgi:heterotetrameric sarcosine oxidase gamma subunit
MIPLGRNSVPDLQILPALADTGLGLVAQLRDEASELAQAPPLTIIAVSSRQDACVPREIESLCGVILPQHSHQVAGADPMAIWMSPGEWLLVGSCGSASGLLRRGEDREGALLISDMSHAYAAFDLTGVGAVDVLASGTSLDLRPGSFDAPGATTTAFAGLRTTLINRSLAIPRYRLLVERAYARYLWTWFEARLRS